MFGRGRLHLLTLLYSALYRLGNPGPKLLILTPNRPTLQPRMFDSQARRTDAPTAAADSRSPSPASWGFGPLSSSGPVPPAPTLWPSNPGADRIHDTTCPPQPGHQHFLRKPAITWNPMVKHQVGSRS